jgi:hypothetical protein
MKKLIIFLCLVITYNLGVTQITPKFSCSVATATTDFLTNIPQGSVVINTADNKTYLCITAATTSDDLTSATAKFKEIPLGAQDSTKNPWKYLGGNTIQRGTGNVGIGTTSPTYLFHVKESNSATPLAIFTNNKGTGFDSTVVINTKGYIGIGLTNPAQILDMHGKLAIDGETMLFAPINTSGTSICVGKSAGLRINHASGLDSYGNSIIGANAASWLTTGQDNTAIGEGALFNVATGSSNVAIGSYSLYTIAGSSSNNVAIGVAAGYYETGSNKLYINNMDRSNLANDRSQSLIYGSFDATPANQILCLGGGGKVGIGITNPTKTLDIVGTLQTTGKTTLGDTSTIANEFIPTGGKTFVGIASNPLKVKQYSYDPLLSFVRYNGTYALPTKVLANNVLMNCEVKGYNEIAETSVRGSLKFLAATDWSAVTSGTYFQISTTASETSTVRMTIGSTGNVGIGVTNPTFLLDVNGTSKLTGAVTLVDKTSSTSDSLLVRDGNLVKYKKITIPTTSPSVVDSIFRTAASGAYASTSTFTFTGTAKVALMIQRSIFRCVNSAVSVLRAGYIKSATESGGTITCTVVSTSDLAAGDKNFGIAFNRKVDDYLHQISIPGECIADASYSQGTWLLDLADTCYILPINVAVRTAAAGSGAALTWNVYSNTTNLFSSAPDIGTNTVLREQRLTTFKVDPAVNVSFRILTSAGVTNKASDLQAKLYIVPTRMFYAY